MRQKDWLAQVLSEASERVDSWPEWKKSPELTRADTQSTKTSVPRTEPKAPNGTKRIQCS